MTLSESPSLNHLFVFCTCFVYLWLAETCFVFLWLAEPWVFKKSCKTDILTIKLNIHGLYLSYTYGYLPCAIKLCGKTKSYVPWHFELNFSETCSDKIIDLTTGSLNYILFPKSSYLIKPHVRSFVYLLISDMMSHLLLDKLFNVTVQRRKTVTNKPLKKLHQKVVTDVVSITLYIPDSLFILTSLLWTKLVSLWPVWLIPTYQNSKRFVNELIYKGNSYLIT